MQKLIGGRDGITRIGRLVYRPAGLWSEQIQRLLPYVRNQSFVNLPEPFGFDEQGREVVSFLPGEVSNYPLSANAASLEALTSAAKLLRGYHDASLGFLATPHKPMNWQFPPRSPNEVICHGDFAPYNVVLNGRKAVGIIDFDTAHPGPRVWDIAYALYRWSPFTNPKNPDGFGNIKAQIKRAGKFCEAYGLSSAQKEGLGDLIIERLKELVKFMEKEAGSCGAIVDSVAAGHHSLYLADIEYITAHRMKINKYLCRD